MNQGKFYACVGRFRRGVASVLNSRIGVPWTVTWRWLRNISIRVHGTTKESSVLKLHLK